MSVEAFSAGPQFPHSRALYTDLRDVIERHSEARPVGYVEVIGVLHLLAGEYQIRAHGVMQEDDG